MPSSFNLRDVLVERGRVSSSEAGKAYIFLFVGSIRPVKDPLYLVNTMAGIVCWVYIIVCFKICSFVQREFEYLYVLINSKVKQYHSKFSLFKVLWTEKNLLYCTNMWYLAWRLLDLTLTNIWKVYMYVDILYVIQLKIISSNF